jgi:hypothetical protein
VLLAGLLGASLPALDIVIAGLGVAFALISWSLCHVRFGFPLHMVLFFPVTMLLALFIAVRSVVLVLRGRTTWRGRTLGQHAVRWW